MKDEKKNVSGKYRVQVLEKALDVLDCFNFQDRELGLSQITKMTGLNITTTKRLLSNFVDRGYLQQDPQSKQYQLGMRLFELGGIVFSSFSLRKAAGCSMTQLQGQTNGTVLLGVNLENQLVYIDKRKGRGILSITSDIGWRRPLHYGMLGMVLMAHSSPETIKKVLKEHPLEAYTPFSITDQNAFSLRLEEIRKNGYSLEKEEAVEGIIGIATPIKNFSRQVVGAIGVALPVSRNSEKEIRHNIRLLKRSAKEISDNLGYLKI